MSDSPESVVRNFLASFDSAKLDELIAFFSQDIQYADPRGAHRGLATVEKLLREDLQRTPSATIDIKTIASDGGTVMVERVDNFEINGRPFTLEVVGVFEVGDDGRIERWREYFDRTPFVQLERS
jgi:limonene-1,2-epoxide hydrolase